MSWEETDVIQRMSNENGKQVMDQADFMMENTMSDEYFYERKGRHRFRFYSFCSWRS